MKHRGEITSPTVGGPAPGPYVPPANAEGLPPYRGTIAAGATARSQRSARVGIRAVGTGPSHLGAACHGSAQPVARRLLSQLRQEARLGGLEVVPSGPWAELPVGGGVAAGWNHGVASFDQR